MVKSIITLILCFLTISTSLKAQHDEIKYTIKKRNRVSFLERTHLGYSLNTIVAKQERIATPFKGVTTTNEYESRIVRTVGGSGFTVGSFYTLTRFNSNIAALAFSMDFTFNKMSWEELDSGFAYRSKVKGFKATDYTVQMGIPLGLDLKLGTDAGPSLNHKWTACFGAGIFPVIAFTANKKKVFKNALNATAGYMPFVKLEGGMKAGVLMKIRLLLLFGGPEYLTPETTQYDINILDNNRYTLTGNFSTNLSLIVYPFSYKWPEYGWWRH